MVFVSGWPGKQDGYRRCEVAMRASARRLFSKEQGAIESIPYVPKWLVDRSQTENKSSA